MGDFYFEIVQTSLVLDTNPPVSEKQKHESESLWDVFSEEILVYSNHTYRMCLRPHIEKHETVSIKNPVLAVYNKTLLHYY